ncbi:MAG: hypothetical protein LBP67_02665 [Bacteroidales bacterium]|jgi:hypothetical protein|nr:hypothetical protein [Bacteroidales bacterium]
MNTIKMGNEEFILYIRKWHPNCEITNDKLGRKIWEWIKYNDKTARQLNREECPWGKNAKNVNKEDMPYTATQFEFDRNLLIRLYDYLDFLATN